MITIKGISVLTTDWHFGLKSNSPNRLKILTTVTADICRYMKENKVDNFIFCGDWYHSRSNISIDIFNAAIKCLEAISRNCKNVYLIVGNHDIFNKNTAEINSVNMFKHMKNVTIIKETTECEINGMKCLFIPWLGNMSYEKETYDMIFGHFEISHKYLMNCFIEESMKKHATKEEMIKLLENDELLRDSGLEGLEEELNNTEETFIHREKSSDLLGDWIEIVKKGGTIFAGHIHHHRELHTKGRNFIFIGSPYQTNRSEINSVNGFYTLKENGTYEFHKLTTPKHVDIKISDILKRENFDFSIIKGNIVHLIFDIEIDRVKESEISRKIYENKPFEELPSDYIVSLNKDGTICDSVDVIKKSKLEYLQMYVEKMDEKYLKDNNLEREKLIDILTEFYNITENDN